MPPPQEHHVIIVVLDEKRNTKHHEYSYEDNASYLSYGRHIFWGVSSYRYSLLRQMYMLVQWAEPSNRVMVVTKRLNKNLID